MSARAFVLLLFFVLVMAVPIAAQSTPLPPDDCDLDMLTDWLIIRQVGWSRVRAAIQAAGPQLSTDNIPLIIQERHNLEDADRPSCADAAYIATIGRYDAYVDGFLFVMADVDIDTEAYNARYDRFSDMVWTTVSELEALVDTDIMAAAAEIIDSD